MLPVVSESNIRYSYLAEEGIFTVCENQQQNLETFWNNFVILVQWEKKWQWQQDTVVDSNSPFLQYDLVRETSLFEEKWLASQRACARQNLAGKQLSLC